MPSVVLIVLVSALLGSIGIGGGIGALIFRNNRRRARATKYEETRSEPPDAASTRSVGSTQARQRRKQDEEMLESVECPICWKAATLVKLIPCGHQMCERCVVNMLLIDKKNCPFCRSEIQGCEDNP